MKRFLILMAAVGASLFVLVGSTFAADVSVREYSDHYVVDIDGSMDASSVSTHSNAAVAPAKRAEVATQPAPSQAATPATANSSNKSEPVVSAVPVNNRMAQSEGYQARLQARQADLITARLAARQARWAKYRKTPNPQ